MSEKYKNIDDLFRDKFNDLEVDPPAHVWDNVKSGIYGSGKFGPGKPFFYGGIMFLSVALIFLGVYSFLFFNSTPDINPEIYTANNLTEINNSTNKSEDNLLAMQSAPIKEVDVSYQDHSSSDPKSKGKKKQKVIFDISQNNNITSGKTSLVVTDNNNLTKTVPSNIQKEKDPATDISEIANELLEISFLKPGDDSELLALNQTEYEAVETKMEEINTEIIEEENVANTLSDNNPSNPEQSSNQEVRSDYGKKGNLKLGVYFTPEMIFYPSNSGFNNRSYSVDLNAIYEFSGYLIQSGIGVNWLSDDGNYKIDYNKYLGSYEDVYNVTFDTTGNEVIPIYHTETVDVYDSIDHITITPTKSNYTYLQIPVLFGYGHENRRFGWFVKGGPSLSILVHENIADINLSDSQNQIINVENELPSRISTNWQFVFSGGVSYKLSSHLSLSVEPVFRYYIKSVYDNTNLNTKNPYSLGLRAGFLLDF
ncbi:MAG: PorT family protein [Bacteroidales bacterium]|nr:PorT family protein [Bacteroidales bacterium]